MLGQTSCFVDEIANTVDRHLNRSCPVFVYGLKELVDFFVAIASVSLTSMPCHTHERAMMRPIIFLFTLLFSFSACSQDVSHTTAAADRRAVLVTGASSGLGKQIALTLAGQGFYVYAGARKDRDIATLSSLPNIEGIRLDVTVQSDIDRAVETIRKEGRGLYGIVNNAGVFLFDALIEVSEEDMQFITDVNVFGPYRVTKAFAPLIIESEGRITTIGSIAGITSGRLLGPYAMTKHAMESYTESLTQEMAKFGVEVSIVEPGNFRSDIMKNMEWRLAQIKAGEKESRYEEEIKRFGGFVAPDRSKHADPQPVADAVVHFMTASAPKVRYLVAPNAAEASFTIQRSLLKTLQLNEGHAYSLDRDALVAMLDQLLAERAQ